MSNKAWKIFAVGLCVLVIFLIQFLVSKDSLEEIKTKSRRALETKIGDVWIGNGISYGAYRDGEEPDKGSLTSQEHILEDLELISHRWNLVRLYGADKQAENILAVIKEHDLPIRVMQGGWLSSHNTTEENANEVDQLIRLANKFPTVIIAVNVGNEIFVDWSAHRIEDLNSVIPAIRKVRSQIRQPVTVVDDYNFWNKPQAVLIAKEIDFIGLNAYAFWNNKILNEAMEWTESIYQDIQGRFPDHHVVYTETGWPTSRIYNDGSYEGTLIGKAGEYEQCHFFDEYNKWVDKNQIVSFFFEAFDENWKGGSDGENAENKAEKHWGLYRSDRTLKKALVDHGTCPLKQAK